MKRYWFLALSMLFVLAASRGRNVNLPTTSALGTTFTYQSQLKDSGSNPVNDICTFNFSLQERSLAVIEEE